MDHCCIEILDYGWNDQPVCQPRSDHGPWTKSLFLHRLEHVRLSLLPRISEHGLYRFWPTRKTEYPEDQVRWRYKICSICVAIILILAYSYLIVNKLCWYFLQKKLTPGSINWLLMTPTFVALKPIFVSKCRQQELTIILVSFCLEF